MGVGGRQIMYSVCGEEPTVIVDTCANIFRDADKCVVPSMPTPVQQSLHPTLSLS